MKVSDHTGKSISEDYRKDTPKERAKGQGACILMYIKKGSFAKGLKEITQKELLYRRNWKKS